MGEDQAAGDGSQPQPGVPGRRQGAGAQRRRPPVGRERRPSLRKPPSATPEANTVVLLHVL